MHQYPGMKMSFSTPSFQHTVLLQTWTPSVPSGQQPAVLLLQFLLSSGGKGLLLLLCLGATIPPGTTVRCFAFPLPTPGLVSFAVRPLHLRGSPVTGAVLCCQCFSLGFCSPVLSNLNRKFFYFLSKNNDDYDRVLSSCFFFLPLPNLGYLHCKPDSVQCWVCLKPALQRWLCPLKPASFLNMECSQLTPWEINYGWFNQPRL